ncbi:hypothetical protein H7K38_14420 [Mycobacterium alsense]|uniref:PE domain-containing protein n=1 Tax=Mycobacterium alsense TaxID=324058 RepID=A0AA42BZK1_9MYCO|nr:hypothetical protein [Mycobacterium alsense]MCV7379842.1 hypothetical protein [Mycobacterium alsense]
MDLAARRPHLSAGIALASAAVIAAGPMTQHLPKLDVTQHLPKVSVTDINLTDATESMMDLFAGVESQLASLAGGGAPAAAVPGDVLGELAQPVETWMNAMAAAGGNIQAAVFAQEAKPFPILQQIGANFAQYAKMYVGAYQTAATSLVAGYFGKPAGFALTNPGDTLLRFNTALAELAAGNYAAGVPDLYATTMGSLILGPAQQLESILQIPALMSQNFANALTYATSTPGLAALSGQLLTSIPPNTATTLGASLQAINNSWAAGDPIGALANAVDTPGQLFNTIFNGTFKPSRGWNNGLLSGVQTQLRVFQQTLAGKIVTPGATNIVAGGTLQGALQNTGLSIVNGWPDVSGFGPTLNVEAPALAPFYNNVLSPIGSQLLTAGSQLGSQIGGQLTSLASELSSLLQNSTASIATSLSSLGSMAATFANVIPAFILSLLKML